MYRRYVKRVIDVALSLAGLLLASWLYLIIMIAIKIDDPGPVFFTQKRVGIHKKYFRLYKFRSMKMSTPHDMPTHLLEDPGVYITRVGRFLRRTSLDEIPQLWNILRGDMSIIGLRPGEKLYEELLMDEEGLQDTANRLIHVGRPIEMDDEAFCRQLEALEQACRHNSPDIRRCVADMVPTYHPKKD